MNSSKSVSKTIKQHGLSAHEQQILAAFALAPHSSVEIESILRGIVMDGTLSDIDLDSCCSELLDAVSDDLAARKRRMSNRITSQRLSLPAPLLISYDADGNKRINFPML